MKLKDHEQQLEKQLAEIQEKADRVDELESKYTNLEFEKDRM